MSIKTIEKVRERQKISKKDFVPGKAYAYDGNEDLLFFLPENTLGLVVQLYKTAGTFFTAPFATTVDGNRFYEVDLEITVRE
jgi:hypothetical protein